MLLPLLAILACAGSEAAEPGSGRGPDELVVHRGDLTFQVLLSGELEAEEAERLVAPNANIWPVQIRWLAEDGIEVEAGDRIMEFDNSQLTTNLEQLRAQAHEAANQLYSLRAQAASAEATATFELEQWRAEVKKARLEAEIPEGVLAERTRQQKQLDLQKAELQFEEAEMKLEAKRQSKRSEIEVQHIALNQALAKVNRSEERLEVLTLKASRDGILILENLRNEGRRVQVGDKIFPGWVVARLPDLSTMMISAQLYDVDDGLITPGMRGVATLDAFPELRFDCQIREIDPIATQASQESLRRSFRTKIDLEQVDLERMRPGMSVKVVLEDTRENVLIAPRQSLDWTGDRARARLAGGDWVPVTLGICHADACEIVDGLEEGTRLGHVPRLSPGDRLSSGNPQGGE